MKLKYFVLLIFITISESLLTEEFGKTELSSSSKKVEEEQYVLNAFKVVMSLLEKIEEKENTIERKDREIKELLVSLGELQLVSNNVQKNKTLEVYMQLNNSLTAHIQDLKSQIDTFKLTLEKHSNNCQTSKNELELNRKVAAYSEIIKEKDNEIFNLSLQINLNTAKNRNCELQLENTIAQNQNMAVNLNETQAKLKDTESNLADSCIAFEHSVGIHKIKVPDSDPFDVLCGSAATGPGWIVIQQRINGKEDFNRDWATYRSGFGSFDGDFFLGLEKIHRLTINQPYELYIHLERFNGEITYATYDYFSIAGEDNQYQLTSLDGFSGNTTDSEDHMMNNVGEAFSTFDFNSIYCENFGGWWYEDCEIGRHLNGRYFDEEVYDNTAISWYPSYSLKKVQMLIRPKIY